MIADRPVELAWPPAPHDSGAVEPVSDRRGREYRLLTVALLVSDLAALALAIVLAGFLRLGLDVALPVVMLGYPERHLAASVLAAPILLALFATHGLYQPEKILAGSREYMQIAHAVTYGVLVTVAISFFLGESPVVSRSWLLLIWLLSIVCVGLARFAVRRAVRRLRQRGVLRTRVAIVGASTFGVIVAEQLRAAKSEGLDVVGFLDEYVPVGQVLVDDIAVVGRPSELVRGFGTSLADEFVLVPQALPHERFQEISELMVSRAGPVLRMAVTSSDVLTHGVLVAERAGIPLVTLRRLRLAGVDAVLKRGLDLLVAGVALVVLSPVAIVLVARAFLNHVRPILVREVVYGVCGSETSFWVFSRGVSGRPLSRGIPALVAVMRGHMSLVGPRPIASIEAARVPGELGLTAVKPGLTGPWRLGGCHASRRDQTLRDLAYVRTYTIWEDARILYESVRSLAREPGSTGLARWADPARSAATIGGDFVLGA